MNDYPKSIIYFKEKAKTGLLEDPITKVEVATHSIDGLGDPTKDAVIVDKSDGSGHWIIPKSNIALIERLEK